MTGFADEVDAVSLRHALRTTQAALARAKAKNDELAAATIDACTAAVLAHGPLTPVPKPKLVWPSGSLEVALVHTTDWQGHKRTATYNGAVMVERVNRLVDKVARLVAIQRVAHPVSHLTLLLGGDMIEGLFNFPTQPFEIDATLFEQYVSVSLLLVEMVRRLLSIFETVEVIGEWGNHGRVGSKRDAVPRGDNVDRMVYEMARRILLEKETRLIWEDCPEDIQRVEIGNYRALLFHGDEVGRNGYASPGTLVQWVTRQKSGAYDWPFTDAYLGHYHTHNEWALPDGVGAVYQTGSTESSNRYAGVHMAATAIPTQRLHMIDPEKGRVTAQFKVFLDED